MRHFAVLVILLSLLSCGEKDRQNGVKEHFTTEVMLRTTPIKDQGKSSFCWIYAMLATIETERLMQGDSINLSPAYVARMFLREQTKRRYVTRGKEEITSRGVCTMLPQLLARHGAMPFDSYRAKDDIDYNALSRRLSRTADAYRAQNRGLEELQADTDRMLDETIGPSPHSVFMYSCTYTPVEFARSICQNNEYIALTSFSHHPFGKSFVLELADNLYMDAFLNVPVSTLLTVMENAILSGHPVCWEGDVSESGFSFERGVAVWDENAPAPTQENRQQAFEKFHTTDDHCMALIGIALDRNGKKYFICKNSWGTNNPYGGLMYMSFDYAKMKTIAIMIPQKAYNLPYPIG